MKLYEINSTVSKDAIWKMYSAYHYTEAWTNSSRVFIAIEIINGTEQRVGMSAALPQSSRAWRSHKVVTLPKYNHLWRAVADAQAQLFLDEGKRYYCNAGSAPPELIAYRDDPASGWVPTTSHGRVAGELGRANSGGVYNSKMRCANAEGRVVSHEYVGKIVLPALSRIEADALVIRSASEEYHASGLSHLHPKGASIGGSCDFWKFAVERTRAGFAAMNRDSLTLRRVVVSPTLPDEQNVLVGQALVRAMCRNYPEWHSITDSQHEAPHYHDYYKVPGVLQSEPRSRVVPECLADVPWDTFSYWEQIGCIQFLEQHPEWHRRIVENAERLSYNQMPGGVAPKEGVREYLRRVNQAARALRQHSPAVQVTYTFKVSKDAPVASDSPHMNSLDGSTKT